jgi:ABC-type Na+ efflux pump permease subunit
MRPRLRVGRVLDVARHDLLDLRRQRGVWLGLLLIPFVTVSFLLLLPGVLSDREQTSQARAVYRVAVQGDETDVRALAAEALPASRFRLSTSADARAAVSHARADAGLVLDGGAGAAAAAVASDDEQLAADLILLTGRSRSRAAGAAVAGALESRGLVVTDRRLALRGLPPSAARPIVVSDVDLTNTSRGRRLSLAALLPLMVLLPVAASVGVAAQRISGSKDQRVFEPLLVLPLTRRELLAGKAVSAYVIGSITVLTVGVPLLAGRFIPIGRAGRSVDLPLPEVVGVMALGALLLVLLVSLGTAVGAASRTSAELGSVLQMSTLPIFLLGSLLQFRSGIVTTVPLLSLPFFGVLLCVRDVAISALTAFHLAVAVAATAVWAGIVLLIASRLLQSERSVLRSTN